VLQVFRSLIDRQYRGHWPYSGGGGRAGGGGGSGGSGGEEPRN
jgi:hypothetical protein